MIDTHAHLTDEVYGGAEDVIKNMRADGLGKIISVGYDALSSQKSMLLAERYADVYFTAGLHPSEANEYDKSDLLKIEKMLSHDKCVCLGEIGLDYHYEQTVKENQKRLLLEQLEILSTTDLPVAFHVRDADGDMLDLVKSNLNKMKRRGVMHCFSGSSETAVEYVKIGFYISFSGSITFKNNAKFPEVIKVVPRERVLIETDCPYLAPTPYRGKTNYPAYVKLTAQKIADAWGVELAEVERITYKNAHDCFSKLN